MAAMIASPAEFRRRLLVDCNGASCPLGDVLDPWQRADFEAMDPAWQQVARRSAVLGGGPIMQRAYLERPRGHSKTTDLATQAAWVLFSSDRKLSGVAAAADQDQAKLLRDGIETLIRLNPWQAAILTVNRYEITNTNTGSTLKILSSDDKSSYGINPDFVIADELTHWPDASGERLWHSLISSAAKRRFCVVVVISNAGFGMGDSWQWKVRESVRTDKAWHFSRLDGPVASWLTPETLDEQRRILPAMVYRRLWGNEWTSGAGDALAEDDLAASLREGPPPGLQKGCVYACGIDLGLKKDFASLVVVGKIGVRYHVAGCWEWRPTPSQAVQVDDIEKKLIEVHQVFRFARVGADPWQAAQLVQRCTRLGIPIEEQPQSGANLVQQCVMLLETFSARCIDVYEFPNLISDLKRLACRRAAIRLPVGQRPGAERPRRSGNCSFDCPGDFKRAASQKDVFHRGGKFQRSSRRRHS